MYVNGDVDCVCLTFTVGRDLVNRRVLGDHEWCELAELFSSARSACFDECGDLG
jgi:hypothetical protein